MHFLRARPFRSVSSARVSKSLICTMSSALDIKNSRVLQSRSLRNEDAKWIGLRAIEWKDAAGKSRLWESADRRTRSGDVDGMHSALTSSRGHISHC